MKTIYVCNQVATHNIQYGNQRCKQHGNWVCWGHEDLHRTGLSSTYQVWQKMEDGKLYTFGPVTAGEIFFCTFFTREYVGLDSPFSACNWIPNIQPVVALPNETFFDVLLTVHLSIFISVFNQLDAQNLFHNKFYFMPLHISSTCARNM